MTVIWYCHINENKNTWEAGMSWEDNETGVTNRILD
jgi:hypothetical protein